QRPNVVGTGQLVCHGVGVGRVLVDEDSIGGGGPHGLGLGIGLSNRVGCSLREGVKVLLVAFTAGRIQHAAAGEIVKVRVDELQADIVVAGAAGLVGIEGGGGSVVQVDRGDDADLPVLLVPKLLGDGLVLHSAGLVHIDGAGVGLVAGGDGCGGR